MNGGRYKSVRPGSRAKEEKVSEGLQGFIETFAAEATAVGIERPVVYLQVLKRQQTGQRAHMEPVGVAVTTIEVIVTGWNREGRVIEWRGCIGMGPSIFEDKVEAFWKAGERLHERVRQLLEGQTGSAKIS